MTIRGMGKRSPRTLVLSRSGAYGAGTILKDLNTVVRFLYEHIHAMIFITYERFWTTEILPTKFKYPWEMVCTSRAKIFSDV